MRISILLILILISSCTYNEITFCEINSPSFNECVKPIFDDNCVSCHSVIGGNLLHLTTFEEISSFDSSVLLDRINTDMPTTGIMSAAEISIIEKWINDGAQNN